MSVLENISNTPPLIVDSSADKRKRKRSMCRCKMWERRRNDFCFQFFRGGPSGSLFSLCIAVKVRPVIRWNGKALVDSK